MGLLLSSSTAAIAGDDGSVVVTTAIDKNIAEIRDVARNDEGSKRSFDGKDTDVAGIVLSSVDNTVRDFVFTFFSSSSTIPWNNDDDDDDGDRCLCLPTCTTGTAVDFIWNAETIV